MSLDGSLNGLYSPEGSLLFGKKKAVVMFCWTGICFWILGPTPITTDNLSYI